MADNLVEVPAFRQDLNVYVQLERPLRVDVDTASLADQEEIVAQGWIKVVDIEPTDAVTHGAVNKTYQDADETVLQTVDVSDYSIDVTVRASYPKVTVDGNAFELSEVADMGHYEDTVSIVLSGDTTFSMIAQLITPDSYNGAKDTVAIEVIEPPVVETLSFTGGYPGSQTELKAGDTFQLTGTTDRAADAIDIQDSGAMAASLEIIASGTSFTVTGTIADRGDTVQSLAARVRARDSVTGGFGATRDTNTGGGSVDGTDLVECNNLHPTASFGAVTYPGSQGALKNTESADVAVTTANYDSLVYSSPTAELSIDSESPTEVTVSRDGGTYNVSTANLQLVATRDANDASTTATKVVNIANVAAAITVTLPASRLVSGGNDGTAEQDHEIQLQTTQLIDGLPTMDEDSGGSRGTFQEGVWTVDGGDPTLFTRTLRVSDDDEKGTFTWEGILITNLAGITTSSVAVGSTYDLGGFVTRDLTFPAFSQDVTLNVAVVDYSKLQAVEFTSTGEAATRRSVQGNEDHAVNEFTISDSLEVNPQTLFWNDQLAAAANSGGTAKILGVEEVA